VDRHVDGPADGGAGPEGDVHGSEDLLVLEQVAAEPRAVVRAHAQLREVPAVGPVAVQVLGQRPAQVALGVGQPVVLHDQPHLVVGGAEVADGGRDEHAAAARRRDEALAARQVAEGRPGREVAVVGDAGAAAQVEPHVGAPGARETRLVGLGEQLGDAGAAGDHHVEVRAHQAGEHLGLDAGQRRAPRAALGGGVARLRMAQGGQARREEDVARRERGGDGRGRLGPALGARRQQDEDAVAAGAHRSLVEGAADVDAVGVGDDEHVLAGADGDAAVDDGLDGGVEVGHGRQPTWRSRGARAARSRRPRSAARRRRAASAASRPRSS
jgi:hypothetical protein